MTLCNMAIEAGGTCGICEPDRVTVDYLWPFIKDEYDTPEAALAAFANYLPDADADYVQTIDHDISSLTPMVTFGYKPDNVKPVAEMAGTPVDQVYIGSCTNGRISDMRIAAKVLEGKRISDSVRAIVSPATPTVYHQALDEGTDQDLHGCRILRHQPHLRRLLRHEQWRPGRRRSLWRHHQPQFQRPHG